MSIWRWANRFSDVPPRNQLSLGEGNTPLVRSRHIAPAGSALAAYGAAVGIECEIAVVEPAPLEKLWHMMACGARIYRVRGFGVAADITNAVIERIREK